MACGPKGGGGISGYNSLVWNWDKKTMKNVRPNVMSDFFALLLLYEVGRFVKMALTHIYTATILSEPPCHFEAYQSLVE